MRLKHKVGAVWGIVGVTLIIGSAVGRVWPRTVDAFRIGLNPLGWVVLAIWVAFMLIGEGYRGFQLKFSPRVAARAWHLLHHGRPIDLWLAPLYCMGYFHATRRRMISSWSLTAGVALIIFAVIHFAQPWRGIIDCGVILGLLYGLIWIYIFTWRTLRSKKYVADPEIASSSYPAH